MSSFYFAYGSNMSLKQMKERCPNCHKVAVGVLRDHEILFPRYSKKRECGVSSIQSKTGNDVWGVIFELTESDIVQLNKCEGFNPTREECKNSYSRAEVSVESDGIRDQKVACFTYVAVPQTGNFVPNANYLETILSGAFENDLPADYIEKLKKIKAEV